MKSLTQFIQESSEQQGYNAAVKAQNSFAAKWWKNRNDEEFQTLINYCKNALGDADINFPYEELKKLFSKYNTSSRENLNKFDKMSKEIIDKYFTVNAQVNIKKAYSLDSNIFDLFTQIVIYALRRINETHNKNLLNK